MAIQGEYRIAASREAVWAALNDAAVLQACIPGCEELTKVSDTEIDAKINAQLGPVRSVFATKIALADLNPPISYTLSGEGKGVAGFGKGSAKVELAEDGAATILRYSADLKLGGKLAQVGSRLLEAATRQLADQFFDAFAKRLDSGATRAAAPPAEAPVATPRGASGNLAWWLVALLAAAAAVWLVLR